MIAISKNYHKNKFLYAFGGTGPARRGVRKSESHLTCFDGVLLLTALKCFFWTS